mgnify:CR=1 FL=1
MTDEIEKRLERLKAATEQLRARADFTARVMSRVASEQSLWFELQGSARVLVPIAALAAAAALAWGVATKDSVDTALTDIDDDGVEVSW